MTPDQIERAANALVAARKGAAIASLPADAIPQSEADSYQIQDAVRAKLGEQVGGWKVGISPVGGHFAAPIYASTVVASPASLPARGFKLIGIECEIGFRFNKALPPRPAPYTQEEVLDAASLHPTIEVVDSRYQDFRSLDRLLVLADNFSNGGLVWGAAVPNWEALDLVRTEMRVTEDGKPLADSAMGVARDPVAALVDFANLTRTRGGAKAGMFVTTGSWTGMVFTRHGTKITADFGPLGRVDIAFAEA